MATQPRQLHYSNNLSKKHYNTTQNTKQDYELDERLLDPDFVGGEGEGDKTDEPTVHKENPMNAVDDLL